MLISLHGIQRQCSFQCFITCRWNSYRSPNGKPHSRQPSFIHSFFQTFCCATLSVATLLPSSARFTMLFQHPLSVLLAVMLLAFGIANADQIPLGKHAARKTITYTIYSTRTRYDFRFHTKTMTRQSVPTLAAPWLAQVHENRRKDNCDETACAMCKLSYQCDPTMAGW